MIPSTRGTLRETRIPSSSRDRHSERRSPQSYVATLTAITIAATCFVSSTSAFTSSRAQSSNQRIQSAPLTFSKPPFGIRNLENTPLSRTTLFATSSTSDQDEWRAMLAAFQMYKAAYGDLKIPTRFVVPAMAPWPEAAWDMQLGKRVAAIRSTGKYVDENPTRRKQLDKLGFIWRARAATKSAVDNEDVPFDQIFDALVVYRNEVKPSGALTVPIDFTVPDSAPWPESTRGLPLGRSVSMFRSKSFLKNNPEAAEKLMDIGFQTDSKTSANDVRFQNVYVALKRYKETYGDLLVPQPFEVPDKSEDWPKETWGLRLGARVNAIRSQGTFVKSDPDKKQMLDDLGFVWSPPESERRKRGRKTKEQKEQEEMEAAAQASRSIVNDMDGNDDSSDIDSFVSSFDFSSISGEYDNEESLSPTWGLEGGRELQDVVAVAKEEAARQAEEEEYKPELTLSESLAEAKRRAIEVGIVEEVDGSRLVKGKRSRDIPWYNDDFGDDFVFDDVVEALTLYKKFYGDFSNFTNEEFVIPMKDEPMSPFDYGDEDEDDGFLDTDPSERAVAATSRFNEIDELSLTDDMMESEIAMFEREGLAASQKTQKATATKIKPLIEVDWPEHLGGMQLGNIVARIRDGSLEVKHLPERKAQLDAIDFDWGDPKYFIDVAFEKAMCAMYAYYLVRGDMFVPADFVMPDEDPWPQALAGYEIGQSVKRIRELQNFLEAYHPDKVSLLRMIEFIWFPTLALPVDPNEPEMTPEMLKLSALGHPDYAKMIDIPMGLPDKIIGDGPFFDSDDPKQWWRKWHNWDYVEDYWYQNGRRDNAFVLRGMGYPQMADEHEEKYGPGLFTQIDETLNRLENGEPVSTAEEKEEMISKLRYFRGELAGCTDIHAQDLEKLVEDIDIQILQLVTGKKGASIEELSEAAMKLQFDLEEVRNGESDEYYEDEELDDEDGEDEDYEEDFEDEDFDVDEELGFDSAEVAES